MALPEQDLGAVEADGPHFQSHLVRVPPEKPPALEGRGQACVWVDNSNSAAEQIFLRRARGTVA